MRRPKGAMSGVQERPWSVALESLTRTQCWLPRWPEEQLEKRPCPFRRTEPRAYAQGALQDLSVEKAHEMIILYMVLNQKAAMIVKSSTFKWTSE